MNTEYSYPRFLELMKLYTNSGVHSPLPKEERPAMTDAERTELLILEAHFDAERFFRERLTDSQFVLL
jgi:hypothetical protein